MDRRALLLGTLPAAAVVASGCSVGAPRDRLLSDQEARILTALADQLIPADDTPGASGALVLRVIDRQLARAYRKYRNTDTEGLGHLDESARQIYAQPFVDLSSHKQETLVERMEQGDLPRDIWGSLPPRDFFRVVRDHVMQGFYGDPRHGGNDDLVGWRMLGVAYPPVRGRDDYRFPKRKTPFIPLPAPPGSSP